MRDLCFDGCGRLAVGRSAYCDDCAEAHNKAVRARDAEQATRHSQSVPSEIGIVFGAVRSHEAATWFQSHELRHADTGGATESQSDAPGHPGEGSHTGAAFGTAS